MTGSTTPTPGSRPFGDDPLEEQVVDSRLIHRGRYMDFRVDTIERADGTRGTRDVVGHPGAVAVLALDAAGRLLLVRQWRIPAGRALLEIPAGTLDVDDGLTEDPDVAARRELEEETGHRATSWRKLATFWTAPGFASKARSTDARSLKSAVRVSAAVPSVTPGLEGWPQVSAPLPALIRKASPWPW